jgi:hypothetical protein
MRAVNRPTHKFLVSMRRALIRTTKGKHAGRKMTRRGLKGSSGDIMPDLLILGSGPYDGNFSATSDSLM